MKSQSDTPIHCIIYISSASKPMGTRVLASILEKSTKNNAGLNVTGMLVYSLGNIIQVLEGDGEVLKDLYNKISKDARHFGIIKLLDKLVNSRSFGEWSMGFRTMNTENMTELKSICESTLSNQDGGQNNSILTLIKNFVINNT